MPIRPGATWRNNEKRRDIINKSIAKPEPTLAKLLSIAASRLGKVTTVIELGARDCTESIEFSRKLPSAHIYSFECNEATLPVCRERTKLIKNLTLVEKAVSDKDGWVTFHPIDQKETKTTWKDGNPGASSMFLASGKYPIEDYVQKSTKVQSVTLEKFVKQNKIDQIDILWMDIQGAELRALIGAASSLNKIKLIHTEVEFLEIYSGQPKYKDIKKFLNKHNFLLIGFTSFGEYAADAVFINKEQSKKNKSFLKDYLVDKTLFWRLKWAG